MASWNDGFTGMISDNYHVQIVEEVGLREW
jgi:hypothetical protein